MNLNTLLRVVMHHKIVVTAVIVITLSTAWGFWVSVLPSYKSDATVLVIPPNRTTDGTEINPLQGLSAKANDIVASTIAGSVNSSEWRAPLVDQGFAADYFVDDGDGTSPILTVTVTAGDADQSTVSRDRVIEALQEELGQFQDELLVSLEDRYTVRAITRLDARVQYGTRDRLVASTVLLGLLAAIAFALLLDAFARSRERPQPRRRDGVAPSANGGVAAEEERASTPMSV